MTYLLDILLALGALTRAKLRVWQLEGERWTLLAGDPDADEMPGTPRGQSHDAVSWLAVPGAVGTYLEFVSATGVADPEHARHALTVVQGMIESENALRSVGRELANRYEEIDLLYTIGELLGRAHAVEEVAAMILHEVTTVVGARRAGLRVYDETRRTLRSVASIGSEGSPIPIEVSVDELDVLVVDAFHSARSATGVQPTWVPGEVLAVPIIYAASGAAPRVVGTLALADRADGGAFTRDETKLITAIATQIGAALENARLVGADRERRKLQHEMQLAHDLQLRLMPDPSVLKGDAEVGVRSEAAESVGGDFYTFARLGRGRVGTMLGDVASHGLAAALIAAEVLAAAGIHANSATPPDDTLALLRGSLGSELAKTEMYLSVFYGILDPTAGRLIYSNAGHPHAFRIPRAGPAERLEPTAPPLGLVEDGKFGRRMVPWHFTQDLLVLFTDGLQDQTNAAGDRYGEPRILARIEAARDQTAEAITNAVFADLDAFGTSAADDRTLLVLRM